MKIKINGEPKEIEARMSVAALIESLGESPKGTAVAINDRLVPRPTWDTATVNPDDDIVIIKAAYGG